MLNHRAVKKSFLNFRKDFFTAPLFNMSAIKFLTFSAL